jgi:hypothetical protein
MNTIFCGVTPCSLVEAYEPVNIYQTARCHITKDNTLNNHTRENVKSHKFVNNMMCVGFQFPVAVTMKNNTFWYVTPCSLKFT